MLAFRLNANSKFLVATLRIKGSAIEAASRRHIASSSVSPSLVKELRVRSGAPMMDCKKALLADSVEGDLDKAMDWLRAKGIAKASNSDRVSLEGLVAVATPSQSHSAFLTLVEVNSETDFISMNRDFQEFVALLAHTVNSQTSFVSAGTLSVSEVLQLQPIWWPGASNTEQRRLRTSTLQEMLADIVSSIRENIVVRRVEVVALPADVQGVLTPYVHGQVGFPGQPDNVQLGRAASVVCLSTNPEPSGEKDSVTIREMTRKLAMHIVAAQPRYLSKGDVPADIIERETAIFREQSADPNKKPEMVERAVQGKVNKRIGELCLLGQSHLVEDGSPVIEKYLSTFSQQIRSTVQVAFFRLWTLGSSVSTQNEGGNV
eukprot:gene24428-32877_t